MCGAFTQLKWAGQSQLVAVSFGNKIAGLQGNTFSGHRMTTGFGPFELLTCDRKWDYSTPKARFYLSGWLSQCYEYTVARPNGGGAEWVELL